MIDSFDNQQFIAQKFNELQQALQTPSIIAHFGEIDPISPRFRDRNSGDINWEKIKHYFVEGRKLMPLSFPQTSLDALIYQILNTYYGELLQIKSCTKLGISSAARLRSI